MGDRLIKRDPSITVVSVDSTEDSHTLRVNCRAFQVRCNDYVQIRWAWKSGETADTKKYQVLNPGQVWWEDHLDVRGSTIVLYLRAPSVTSGSATVSIQEWV